MKPFCFHNEILTGPILSKSCVGNYSCSEFMSLKVLLCLEDAFFCGALPSALAGTFFPALQLQCLLSFGEDVMDVSFGDEHRTVLFLQHFDQLRVSI